MAEEERVPTPPLPPDTIPLTTQVSGHFYGKKSTKLGMLQLKDGTLVKPLIPPKGDRELKFYQEIYDTTQNHDDKLALRPLLPKYVGVWTTPLHPEVQYIMLENITTKYNKPCVLDVKVGPRTWEPDAPDEKRLRELEKYPPQAEIGFRLLGIKVYHTSRQCYTQYDHLYLRSLAADQIIPKGISVYLDVEENCKYKCHVINNILKKLHKIQEWFQNQSLYHFYASSILVVYEGNPTLQGNGTEFGDNGDNGVDVRLIDFTHICSAEGQKDDNYYTGVSRLIEHFEETLHVVKQDL